MTSGLRAIARVRSGYRIEGVDIAFDCAFASSFRLEPELAHQRAPFALFLINIGSLLLWRRGKRLAALIRDARAHVLGLERYSEFGIEPPDDAAWRPGRRYKPIADHRLVASHRLRDGRHIGQDRRASKAG